MEKTRKFFKSFRAKVDVSDEQYINNEKERNIRWNVNPFREPRNGLAHGGSKAEDKERPQEWLELAGDLAWTTTFSSVTSNQAITDPMAVWNYTVFFFLTWHLWATQTSYDIRFYTHDWVHRFCFVAQLGIYAILAACSGSFNVGWNLSQDWAEAPKGNVSALTAQTMDQNQRDLITKTFRAINIWLFASRLLLLCQYALVTWRHRKRSGQFWTKRFYLIPAATAFSAILFLVCYVIVRVKPDSKGVAIAQLTLWGVAVIVQALAGAFTPNEHKGALKSECDMSNRLGSFTVIIMGEGLNGIVGTLRHNMSSLGITGIMLGEAVSILFMLYLIWLLYFDGFRFKYSPGKKTRELWLYLHFFFHLSLIMLLEGVKNVFTYLNVLDLIKHLQDAFGDALTALEETGHFPPNPKVEDLLKVIGISWQEKANSLGDAITRDAAEWTDASWNNVTSTYWKWWGDVIHNVILLYNEDKDEDAEAKFQVFMNSTDTAIAQDYADDNSPLFAAFSTPYFDQMAYTGKWVVVVGGFLLVFMAIINILQCRPKNRYAWSYSIIRLILGVALCVIGGVGSLWIDKKENWVFWTVPFIALSYLVGVLFDGLVLYRSVHFIRKLGAISPHLPPLPYGPARPQGSGSSPNVTDAHETKGSSGLYAAGGETEKSHGEKSISSSV